MRAHGDPGGRGLHHRPIGPRPPDTLSTFDPAALDQFYLAGLGPSGLMLVSSAETESSLPWAGTLSTDTDTCTQTNTNQTVTDTYLSQLGNSNYRTQQSRSADDQSAALAFVARGPPLPRSSAYFMS
jgi:hypothetical protein